LSAVRTLMTSAGALEGALAQGRRAAQAPDEGATRAAPRGRKAATTGAGPAPDPDETVAQPPDGAVPKATASDRRAAAASLLTIWASVARDLAVAGLDGRRQLHDPELVDELAAAGASLAPGAVAAFLQRLEGIAAQLQDNVNPELALDVLALSWPRPAARRAKAAPVAAG
jgi:hypothetical protein